MSHPLAFANQNLYYANILLAAWRRSLSEQESSAAQINQAFGSAVQARLLDGYGWLLLTACRIRHAPDRPPHSVDDLPPLPTGLVRPAEVQACAQLEQDGWLAELKSPLPESPVVRRTASLAQEVEVSIEQFLDWSERLGRLSQQVADAVDES